MLRDTTDSEIDSQDRRDTIGFWLRWIRAAKKAAKDHWDDSKDAWEEYENKPNTGEAQIAGATTRTNTQRYPIYYSSCKTLEPAYFARTPDTVTRRMFDIDDPMATTMCMMSERFSKYLIERCNHDSSVRSAVQDFIHADKASLQVVYEADIVQEMERKPLMMQMGEDGETSYYDGGNLHEGEVSEDEEGYFYQSPIEKASNKHIKLVPTRFNKVIHTPNATSQDEIIDMAYWFCLDYDEACKKFPNISPDRLPWRTDKAYKEDEDSNKRPDTPGKFLEGWECWSKRTKKVYFVCEDYEEGFLKEPAEDPYKLRTFFPSTPFIIGSPPSGSLYPTPAWVHVRATAKILHKMYGRVFSLIEQVRRRAIVDESNTELLAALQDLDSGEFITSRNMQAILDKGGLANMVAYLPVKELVEAIAELSQLEDKFKNNFYEWFGVPDILRGASDPIETAAAQQIKQGSAHDRFKYQKKQVMDMDRDAIEMMMDLGYQVYDDTEMAEILGYQYMQPDDQQRFFPALQILRNDPARLIRIEIETDSTSFVDERVEQEQRNAVGQLIIGGLDKIAAMAQTTPMFVPVALRTLLYGISGLKGGKDFDNDVVQAVNQLVEQASQPQAQPPPPPDYEAMKIEQKRQEVETKARLSEMEMRLKEQDLMLKDKKINAEMRSDDIDARLEQQSIAIKQMIETKWQEIDQIRLALDAREKLIEEKRLAIDTQLQLASQATPKALTINLGGKGKVEKESEEPVKPKKRRYTPAGRDLDGNAIAWDVEDVV